jgi:DNA polymerase-3 subunit delta
VKLTPQQLRSHLAGGLAPHYLISGDEPLLVDEALAAIRDAATKAGYTERERHVAERSFDWEELRAGLQNMSLFSERRSVELRLPTGKPGDKGSRFLSAIAAEPVADVLLVVITPALDSRAAKSKWVSSLAGNGAWLPLRTPDDRDLPGWIAARLKRAGLAADPEAAALLAARVEGNLLAAQQEIDKLSLLNDGNKVTVESVRAAVADGARYDVFQLSDAALAGNCRRASRILDSLRQEGVAAPLVLWSLAREVTAVSDVALRAAAGRSLPQAMRDAGVWQSRQKLIGRAASQLNAHGARQLLDKACKTDRIVKGARRGSPWNALMELTLALAGDNSVIAEIA